MSLILVRACKNRDFWRRHRRKLFVTVGVLGSGYLLYKLYDANRRRDADLERYLAEREKFIKAQLIEIQISCFCFLSIMNVVFQKYAFFGF